MRVVIKTEMLEFTFRLGRADSTHPAYVEIDAGDVGYEDQGLSSQDCHRLMEMLEHANTIAILQDGFLEGVQEGMQIQRENDRRAKTDKPA